jgi:hypothetical protein
MDEQIFSTEDLKLWELRVRLLELGERTLVAMGRDIKDVGDVFAMAKWFEYRSNELLQKDITKESPIHRPYEKGMKEKFGIV